MRASNCVVAMAKLSNWRRRLRQQHRIALRRQQTFFMFKKKTFRHNEMGFHHGGCSLHFPSRQTALVSPKETFCKIYIPLTSNKFYGNLMIVEDKKETKFELNFFSYWTLRLRCERMKEESFLLNNNKLVYNFNSIDDASRRKVFASTDE